MAPSAISDSRASSIDEPNGLSLSSSAYSSSNGQTAKSKFAGSSTDDVLDLIGVGFGPASLAIAIALHDAYRNSPSTPPPQTLFLEKQPEFAWHAGMQLPGAKMQISFLKDLATPRDPKSPFTFINYVHQKGRLNHFINLGTFLPSRAEYEDYLRWCASHFSSSVQYNREVVSVDVASRSPSGKVTSFSVASRDQYGNITTRKARHVVIAAGGKAVIPPVLQGLKRVAHSSQYATSISQIEKREQGRKLNFVVIGNGQSAAEIFNDLWNRFPDAQVRLVIKGASLRQSDDSPFVNEIFDPDRVDGIYAQSPSARAAALALDRGTNYGVVRISLLEHLYDALYSQRLRNPDPKQWRCQILNQRVVTSATQGKGENADLLLKIVRTNDDGESPVEEELHADYVFAATGYLRNTHETLLSNTSDLLSPKDREGKIPVGRDYRVLYDADKVDEQAGIWLQGCNEATHGLSDTLLSILAIRGGEIVQNIFGQDLASSKTI